MSARMSDLDHHPNGGAQAFGAPPQPRADELRRNREQRALSSAKRLAHGCNVQVELTRAN